MATKKNKPPASVETQLRRLDLLKHDLKSNEASLQLDREKIAALEEELQPVIALRTLEGAAALLDEVDDRLCGARRQLSRLQEMKLFGGIVEGLRNKLEKLSNDSSECENTLAEMIAECEKEMP